MMREDKKLNSGTNSLRHLAVYAVKILSLLCIMFVTGVLLLNEFDNKLAALLIAACGLLLLFAAKRLLTKHAGMVENIFPAALAGSLFFLFILQMAFAVVLRFTPAWDMQAVYDGAVSWVENGDFDSYYKDYFYYFPNNLGLLTVLWAAFKAAKFIGIRNYFMVGCFLGALSVDTMFFCVAMICKKQMGAVYGVLSILVMLFFPPLYFAPTAFYTDVMSMFAPALCYLLYLYSKDCTEWKTRIAFYIGMAAVLAVGMEIKFPVAIMLIAVAIETLLMGGGGG